MKYVEISTEMNQRICKGKISCNDVVGCVAISNFKGIYLMLFYVIIRRIKIFERYFCKAKNEPYYGWS